MILYNIKQYYTISNYPSLFSKTSDRSGKIMLFRNILAVLTLTLTFSFTFAFSRYRRAPPPKNQ